MCPRCHSRDVAPAVVSGRGTVHSFTVNHQPWDGVGDTYVIALVALAEQEDVRLTTNLVDIEPETVRIGMPVRGRLRRPRSRLSAALSAGDAMTAAERRAIISGIGQSRSADGSGAATST